LTPTGPPSWSSRECLGKTIDLRFISNDCERVVVLHKLPEGGLDWKSRPVAHVYNRGTLDYPVAAGATVRNWSKIQSAGTSFYWLQGVLAIPGREPRYNASGNAVELETIDGKTQLIPLVRPPVAHTASAKPPLAHKAHRHKHR
jgi:hypothetical protein